MCVSGLSVIDLSGAVALVLLEFCVKNREEYAELAFLYHAAEVLVFTAQRPMIIWALCGRFCVRVNVATLLVKEWMIILTVFLHVLHCKISSVMPLESPSPELHFC